MNRSCKISERTFYWAMAFFAIVFFCFPSHNMSPDAITYAADVKYGYDIFTPHHLLFNAMHWCIYRLVLLFYSGAEVLTVMHCATALISLCTLLATYKTLRLLTDTPAATALTIFTGCCFGFLRYTAECEVYVTPILFSILSTYWFIRYLNDDKAWQVILTAILASIAVLFHQIHLFWGIGLFTGLLMAKRYKGTAIYALCTLSVLVVYSIVLVCYAGQEWSPENLIKYIATYYYSDSAASSGIGVKNFIMTPVSFIRTFIQVHGDIAIQLSLKPVLYAVFAIIPLLIFLLIKLIKETTVSKKPCKRVAWTAAIIFALQLLFATYSDGNMEFMVMLPFALVIVAAAVLRPSVRYTIAIGAAMFIWNFTFALWPAYHYDQYNREAVVEYVHAHPAEEMVAIDAAGIGAVNYLKYGEYDLDRVIYLKDVEQGKEYITDVIDRPKPFNRQKFLENTSGDFEVIDTVATIDADYGTYHLFRVIAK